MSSTEGTGERTLDEETARTENGRTAERANTENGRTLNERTPGTGGTEMEEDIDS